MYTQIDAVTNAHPAVGQTHWTPRVVAILRTYASNTTCGFSCER